MITKEEGEGPTLHRNETDALNKVDNNESDETIPRGNEWEVVSLTASAYAAAPGPQGNESIHEENSGPVNETNEAETSLALFMSRHFAFPPSQHENLPIDPNNSEIPKGDEVIEHVSEMNAQIDSKKSEKEDDNWDLGNLNVLIDGKDNTEFDDTRTKGPNIFGTTKISSLHSGEVIDGCEVYNEDEVVSDLKCDNEEVDECDLPCEAWWKRGVASICAHAKETSTYCSVLVAVAVMGLVLVGQRWQQERWRLSINDEKSGRILSRLKEVILSGSRRGTYITAASGQR